MRYKLIQKVINFHNNFLHLESDQQFRILMDDNLVKDTADFLYSAYRKRCNALYKYSCFMLLLSKNIIV